MIIIDVIFTLFATPLFCTFFAVLCVFCGVNLAFALFLRR